MREGVVLVIEGDVSVNEVANHECQGCNLKMTNALAFGIVPVLIVPSLIQQCVHWSTPRNFWMSRAPTSDFARAL